MESPITMSRPPAILRRGTIQVFTRVLPAKNQLNPTEAATNGTPSPSAYVANSRVP
jgi:hypothetical protein